MTEKRLIFDEDYNIIDTESGAVLDAVEMFDLVNVLWKENFLLRRHLKSAKDHLQGGYTKKAIERLKVIDVD